jgi:hypothetical protein
MRGGIAIPSFLLGDVQRGMEGAIEAILEEH